MEKERLVRIFHKRYGLYLKTKDEKYIHFIQSEKPWYFVSYEKKRDATYWLIVVDDYEYSSNSKSGNIMAGDTIIDKENMTMYMKAPPYNDIRKITNAIEYLFEAMSANRLGDNAPWYII